MIQNHPFSDSLHPISIWRAFEASLGRTPQKVALSFIGGELSYVQLHALVKVPSEEWKADASRFQILQLLQSLWLSSSNPGPHLENTPLSRVTPTLTERELALSILNIAVSHPILSRDSVSVCSFPIDPQRNSKMASDLSPIAAIANMAPLFLGGTLCLVEPGDLSALVHLISKGLVNQAWLDQNTYTQFLAMKLPAPHADFRGLICVGLPSAVVCQTLTDWVGLDRLHVIALDKRAKPWARHVQLSDAIEPYPGFGLDDINI